MNVRLTYHGHSCFTIACGDYSVVIDPYDPRVPGYQPLRLRANQVLCSHKHGDHAYKEAVTLIPGPACPFRIETMEVPHDDVGGAKRGMTLIHLFACGGLRIAHLGDIGCMPKEEVAARLMGLDVLLIPVGGTYTIDAAQANDLAKRLAPRIVVPMHYRLGELDYREIGPLDAFTSLRKDVVFSQGNTLEIAPDTPAQTLVLRYLPEQEAAG